MSWAQQHMRFVSWPKLYDWARARIGDTFMGDGRCSIVVSGEDAAGARKRHQFFVIRRPPYLTTQKPTTLRSTRPARVGAEPH